MSNYYAVLTLAAEGGWLVRFPDVPAAATHGETFEQAHKEVQICRQ